MIDVYARRIVGWRVASNMRTDMVLDSLEMARWTRGGGRLEGLICHSDAGSQYTSIRYTERIDEIGARPSIGTIADSYDNALAETINGLYKAEVIHRQSWGKDRVPGSGVTAVALAVESAGAQLITADSRAG